MAQRAFFEQALGRSAAPAAPAQDLARPAPRVRQPDLRIDIPEAPPAKILRPGSIIDIKV